MTREEGTSPQAATGGLRRLTAALRRAIGSDEPELAAEAEAQVDEAPPPARAAAPAPPPAVPQDVAARIQVQVLQDSPELTQCHEIATGFAKLADAGLWPSVLDRLRGTDQSRQHFTSGSRYYDCALPGAIDTVLRHTQSNPADIAAAEAALPALEEVRRDYPRDYVPAVLLTRALTEIGWAIRGEDAPARTDPEAAERAAPYFARAEAILEAFDPIEHNSPMIAEARYRLAAGVEGGEDFVRDWYEDWADLDPSNPAMLMAHGRRLMPDWYGDYDELEAEARRAVQRARGGVAEGAYTFFWWPALDGDDTAPAHIDPVLFVDGIHRTLSATRSQDLANSVAALLYRLAKAPPPADSGLVERWLRAQAVFEKAFAEVLRRHVRAVVVPHWPFGQDGIKAAIVSAFREELAGGARIVSTEKGLEAQRPSAAI